MSGLLNAMRRSLGLPPMLTPEERLEAIVAARAASPEIVQYRRKREAALKGRRRA